MTGVAPIASASLPSLHYLGGKGRLLGPILRTVRDISKDGDRVLDLFAGSGVVSRALQASNRILANDIQEYSRVLSAAVLASARLTERETTWLIDGAHQCASEGALAECLEPMMEYEQRCALRAMNGDAESLAEMGESGGLQARLIAGPPASVDLARALDDTIQALRSAQLLDVPGSTVTRYFGGIYFSYAQAVALDALLSQAALLPCERGDIARASAIYAATSCVATVGKHFAQPMNLRRKDGSIKANLVSQSLRDRSLDPLEAARHWLAAHGEGAIAPYAGQSQRLDFADALRVDTDISVVYADPPYTRDHYSRFYHVLETMMLRDEPALTKRPGTDQLARGLYRTDRHQSPFSIRSRARGAFETLFERTSQRGASLVLSYTTNPMGAGGALRVLAPEALLDMAEDYFRQVTPVDVALTHSKLNSQALTIRRAANDEVLLVCQP